MIPNYAVFYANIIDVLLSIHFTLIQFNFFIFSLEKKFYILIRKVNHKKQKELPRYLAFFFLIIFKIVLYFLFITIGRFQKLNFLQVFKEINKSKVVILRFQRKNFLILIVSFTICYIVRSVLFRKRESFVDLLLSNVCNPL